MALTALRFILSGYLLVAPAASYCCAQCPGQSDEQAASRCGCCKPAPTNLGSCCSSTPTPEASEVCVCCFEQAIPANAPILPPSPNRTIEWLAPTFLLVDISVIPCRLTAIIAASSITSWPSIMDQSCQTLFGVWLN